MASAASGFDFKHHIMDHVSNSHEWHLPFLPTIHLPPFLSLHVLMLILGAVTLIVLFCFVYNKTQAVPTGITNLLETLVLVIRDDIAIPCLGKEDARKMTPLFCTFFFFILILNLLGLIPIFATATANFNVTGALALITFSFMIFGAIYKNGFTGFLKAFVPSGVPFPVLFIVVPIEMISVFIKTFALMVRLFANLLAGHIVILSLIGLLALFGIIALPAIALALFIYLLEILVAFIQAYIFTLLSALFIGMIHHPEH